MGSIFKIRTKRITLQNNLVANAMKELTQQEKKELRQAARKLSPTAKMYPKKQEQSPSPLVEQTILDIMRVYKVDRERALQILSNPL